MLACAAGEGLGDPHLTDGMAHLTALTRLAFRGSTDTLTDEVRGPSGCLARLQAAAVAAATVAAGGCIMMVFAADGMDSTWQWKFLLCE